MYEHEIALQELNLNINDLPRNLVGMISNFKRQQKALANDPENATLNTQIKAQSIAIADALQDYAEKDLPEEEIINPNPNNMLTHDDLDRAKAVGLTETATMEQVEAAEAKVKADADEKAKADATAAQDAEKASAEEKAKADKEAAEKLAADEKSKTDAEAAEKLAAETAAREDYKKTALGAIGL